MLWNITFTYLLFSIPYVNSTNMIIAVGPYVYNINLTNGNIVTKYFYLPFCGSSSCLPLCTDYVNNTILVGTTGALVAIRKGTFKVLSYQPTFNCGEVLVHNIIYHDSFNVKMISIIEGKDVSKTYDNCMCLGWSRDVISLVCKNGNFLVLGKRKVKVEAPALLSKPLGNLVAAITANGKLYIINTSSMRVIDTENLNVLRVSPSVPWPWRGGFLLPTPRVIYYWKNGELYYYRTRNTLLGVFANNNIVILALLTQGKLNITAISADNMRFQKMSGGGII